MQCNFAAEDTSAHTYLNVLLQRHHREETVATVLMFYLHWH